MKDAKYMIYDAHKHRWYYANEAEIISVTVDEHGAVTINNLTQLNLVVGQPRKFYAAPDEKWVFPQNQLLLKNKNEPKIS